MNSNNDTPINTPIDLNAQVPQIDIGEIKLIAKVWKTFYDAYVSQGFAPEQAMQIVIAWMIDK